jgi:hypothetical protein
MTARGPVAGALGAAMRGAAPVPLERELVASCLLRHRETGQLLPREQLFVRAWEGSLDALSIEERRGGLSGVTGHVAESVVELMLVELGYQPIWHFAGTGEHGVDVLLLFPDIVSVLAVEVKGTLRAGRWPRFSKRDVEQMSSDWLNKADNPGMANWELRAQDVYGAVFSLNFAEMAMRGAFTDDFAAFRPVGSLGDLAGMR